MAGDVMYTCVAHAGLVSYVTDTDRPTHHGSVHSFVFVNSDYLKKG